MHGFSDSYRKSNHLHMIISSEVEGDTSNIMRDFKKFTSKEIIKELKYDNQESRKEWMLNHFAYAAKNDKKIKDYKFWQDGIDVQGIYLESYFEQKINYIHNNPVKAEIVSRPEDYNYSSAVDYSGEKGLLDIVFA